MDQGKLTGAVFIDLQKAFDTVDHSVLLWKLPFYGITGNELIWIESYLSGLFQYVHYDNVKLELQLVKIWGTSGIDSWSTPVFDSDKWSYKEGW